MTSFRVPIRFSGFTPPVVVPPTEIIQAGGWADLHPEGVVTGGAGGAVLIYDQDSSYLANNGTTYFGWEALWEQMRDNRQTVQTIYWDGPNETLLLPKDYRVDAGNETNTNSAQNKSIIFTRGQTLRGGAFVLSGWKNCIFRNWTRKGDGLGDGKTGPHSMKGVALRNCERIWVDHWTIDGEGTTQGTEQIKDGAFDIGAGTNYVTLSNSWIRRCNKTMLIGSSDGNPLDVGKLKITYRNNLFENNMTRQPLCRNGQIHLLNNLFYYTPKFIASATQYQWSRIIELNFQAQVYSQGNYYYGHRYWLNDSEYLAAIKTSGIISDNDAFDPDPTFSSFLGNIGTLYPPVGSVRPELVTWNPNTLSGYVYPTPLMTPEQAEAYVIANAGANLIIEPIV
jgi:pectate lyase